MKHKLMLIVQIAMKEWRLLLRNPHGLIVLFLMPAVFVLIMSFTLKNTLVTSVDMPTTGWVLQDDSPAAAQWMQEWHENYGTKDFASTDALLRALKQRSIQAGIVVHEHWIGNNGYPDASQVEIWLGNGIQPAAAGRLRAQLGFSMLQARLEIAAAQTGAFASTLLHSAVQPGQSAKDNAPEIRYLYEIESGRKITAVQQSVPAWLIFGMFFVVIPIAGVLIQERNDGTLARLATFGISASVLLGGKLLAFMILNWIQLAFMVAVGHWVVPWLGGDTLYLDINIGWFLLMVASTSAAAVSLALAVAAWTRTFDQAAALGSGLNVALGAIAGVMVPRMLMPPKLQTLSEWSPMGWALDGLQLVFLGTPDAAFLLLRVALLLLFALLLFMLGWWRIRSRALMKR
jgi:ABC-2 type transport system permease protein